MTSSCPVKFCLLGRNYPFLHPIDTCFAAQVWSLPGLNESIFFGRRFQFCFITGCCCCSPYPWTQNTMRILFSVNQYWLCYYDFNKKGDSKFLVTQQWLRLAVKEWDLSAQVKSRNLLAWTFRFIVPKTTQNISWVEANYHRWNWDEKKWSSKKKLLYCHTPDWFNSNVLRILL